MATARPTHPATSHILWLALAVATLAALAALIPNSAE